MNILGVINKKTNINKDVIKGAMSWKKFASQGLQSLANTPTLTDVWVPRWTNTFGVDVLPLDTPPLLAGLPLDDKQDLNTDVDSASSTYALFLVSFSHVRS